jgi:hypothetical protein
VGIVWRLLKKIHSLCSGAKAVKTVESSRLLQEMLDFAMLICCIGHTQSNNNVTRNHSSDMQSLLSLRYVQLQEMGRYEHPTNISTPRWCNTSK